MNWTTITNPIIWADAPDPSVIRVGSTFYMVSTSMHSMPGCPIMKSEDLLNWELVNYVYDTFEDNEAHHLQDGKGIYGKGSWAASLRYNDGKFYVCFSSLDMNQFYVYTTSDIENGEWERNVIQGLHHDPSMLFDDDGRVFVFHGNGDIRITELTADATALKPDGINQLLLETDRDGIMLRAEGCHAYKVSGYYYLFFIDWPNIGNKRRRQLCYRSSDLLGPYEHKLVLDDHMHYRNNGIAQGGIIDTPDGDWYTVLFQDHGAVGRIPCVLPVAWENGWPVLGQDGRAPQTYEVKLASTSPKPLVISDEFDYDVNRLELNWQWNHNPDPDNWSVTDRSGYLRLTTGHLANSVEFARNTLTQRTEGPACIGTTVLDAANMQPGDRAGLVALQYVFGSVGIQVDGNGDRYVAMSVNGRADGSEGEITVERTKYEGTRIYLQIEFQFDNGDREDIAHFRYSSDGEEWQSIGSPLQLHYKLEHFMGYRFGLYNYATKQTGGFVDYDYFHYKKLV
ncbi:glycoside hydrolase family 43 protein [Paenibacillus sp. YIM B09110]|uniref:glycoside hydrolase family 43 protein n=1 Tax=Paenibacillus sp. YIM B09110 TaxID=3126102 RepID=UPI00301BB2E2